MIKKTNAMRILDSNKIKYKCYSYEDSEAISGVDVAHYLNENVNQVFKTLVTIGHSKNYYVFVVPVSCELNLKKAAKSVNEKSIELIKQKDLFDLTGYVHGGCSPIGMKKRFKTIFDKSILNFDTIMISGGKVGFQIEIGISDLQKVIVYELFDIV